MSARANKHFLVLGFGLTGQSIARYLRAQGRDFVVTDDDAGKLAPGSAGFDDCEFARVGDIIGQMSPAAVEALYVSPGIAPGHPLVRWARGHAIEVATDIGLFFRDCQAPVISVTGTNGKSTVVSLINKLLGDSGVGVAMGGNIGTPALDLLANPAPDYYLLELSSFQLHYSPPGARNHIGILTNISCDHLDFHGGLADYIERKRRVFDHNRYSICFRDQAQTRLPPAGSNASFGYGRAGRARDYGLLGSGAGLKLTRGRRVLRAVGELDRPLCFLVNVMPALAVLDHLGFDAGALVDKALATPLLDHRYSRIGSGDGIHWIDASKATNPHAAINSLPAALDKAIVLLGGNTKGADMSVLNAHLAGIKKVIAYSDSAGLIKASLADGIPVELCADLPSAVAASQRSAGRGDTVLLAPAAASQPVYRDYQARGRHFARLVQERSGPQGQ